MPRPSNMSISKPILEREMTNTTAAARFTEHEKQVSDLLNAIAVEVKKLRTDFEDNGRTNWAFVGDLTQIEESLRDVHNFLTNKE